MMFQHSKLKNQYILAWAMLKISKQLYIYDNHKHDSIRQQISWNLYHRIIYSNYKYYNIHVGRHGFKEFYIDNY